MLDGAGLAAFLSSNGLRPDEDHLALLRVINGCYIRSALFTPVTGLPDTDLVDMHAVYGYLHPDACISIEPGIAALRKLTDQPLLPVAYDSTGSFICIDQSAERPGRIVLWDWLRVNIESHPSNTYHIADSFSEFMGGLVLDPP